MIHQTIPCKGCILLPICLIKIKDEKFFHKYLIISKLATKCKKLQFYLQFVQISVSEIERKFEEVYENRSKTSM